MSSRSNERNPNETSDSVVVVLLFSTDASSDGGVLRVTWVLTKAPIERGNSRSSNSTTLEPSVLLPVGLQLLLVLSTATLSVDRKGLLTCHIFVVAVVLNALETFEMFGLAVRVELGSSFLRIVFRSSSSRHDFPS